MTLKVGSLPLIWEKGYRLYVELADISGLDEKSRIRIAGVESGIVEKIRLEEGKAKLTLLINPDVKIYGNAEVSLRMSGLLGDKYIALTTGTPDEPALKNGDTITHLAPTADIDMLATHLTRAAKYMGDLTQNLNRIFGEEEREAITESIYNLKIVTKNLKEISTENREPLNNILVRLENFTEALSEKGPGFMDDASKIAKDLREKGPGLIDDLSTAATELKEAVQENRYTFKESMENIRNVSESASNIAQRIERGEGTLGKLVTEDELYDSLSKVTKEASKSFEVVGRLRTFLDFHTEYNTGEAEWKGFFNLTLQPREDKSYILGIVTDPKGSVETTRTTINGTNITKEEIEESEIEFTAQFAKRFDDIALRIGLLESTFGVGADYFFYNDRGRVKFDIWDFSADEAGADNAHARIGVDYTIFKHIFLSGGIDNVLNSDRRGIYVGGGLKFEDKDLKYLLGNAPNITLRD
jgi:phospholipid/cholesterol/gamma-HCH transport system substrate-binding protein